MTTRVCTWCGETVPAYPAHCPHCEARLQAHLPDVAGMTPEARAQELESFLPILEVDFSLMHGRIEELAGRPVFTHELARYAEVIAQVRGAREPTAEEWGAPLEDHGVIVVQIGGKA